MARPLIVMLICLVASPAVADGPGKVALSHVTAEGDLPPAIQQRLVGGIETGLRAGLALVSFPEVRAQLEALSPALLTCTEGPCLAELGKLLGARVLVRAAIKQEIESYYLTLSALDSLDGSVLYEEKAECEICTLIEASNTVTAGAERFAAEVATLMATLPADAGATRPVRITSLPRGAAITLDGERVGATDLDLRLAPGTHQLLAEADGYVPSRRALEVAAGTEPLVIELNLEADVPFPDAVPDAPVATGPAPAPPVAPKGPADGERFAYGTAALISLGGGLALLGTGGVLMGLDGEKACSGPLETCPTVYDTGGAGLATVVVGGAGLVGAVVLFVMEQAAEGIGPEVPPKLPGRKRATLAPWADPARRAAGVGLSLALP